MDLSVVRYAKWDKLQNRPSGDYLCVGTFELGHVSVAGNLEFERAKRVNPRNPAGAKRPMFYTGSPYGAEILALFDPQTKKPTPVKAWANR